MRGVAVVLVSVGTGIAIGINIEQTLGSKVLFERAYEWYDVMKDMVDKTVKPALTDSVSKAMDVLSIDLAKKPADSIPLRDATESEALQRLGQKLSISERKVASESSSLSYIWYCLLAGAASGLLIQLYGTERVAKACKKTKTVAGEQLQKASSSVVAAYKSTPASTYVDNLAGTVYVYAAPFIQASEEMRTQLARDLSPLLQTTNKYFQAVRSTTMTTCDKISSSDAVKEFRTKSRRYSDKLTAEAKIIKEGVPLLAAKTGDSIVAKLRVSAVYGSSLLAVACSQLRRTFREREGVTGSMPPSASNQASKEDCCSEDTPSSMSVSIADPAASDPQVSADPKISSSWISSDDMLKSEAQLAAPPRSASSSSSSGSDPDGFTMISPVPSSVNLSQ
mmetsp:Transcript_21027/g.25247  ORF Transcript_21027/g.25247 Transcript_21027/m.25247 type:complete len:394 (+) Transcript_21027:144-1325(+)|eukprot:CAMPEP_0197847196 /NCGR_PEP_ID=MMETSP1438-20131217/5484_1 /TAXON_ID=1461541 /ORGANISM="Pterosperma sp., Strain CCMP1384" /LENGTH=393 /DNA_ID=CAMNT_0043459057 /DNA_START=141 /DNA_END=1322 /DNA_ORIENTATION=-